MDTHVRYYPTTSTATGISDAMASRSETHTAYWSEGDIPESAQLDLLPSYYFWVSARGTGADYYHVPSYECFAANNEGIDGSRLIICSVDYNPQNVEYEVDNYVLPLVILRGDLNTSGQDQNEEHWIEKRDEYGYTVYDENNEIVYHKPWILE